MNPMGENPNDKLTVMSLFDGMACGRLALDRAGLPVRKYYASEIDKYPITVAKNNHPDIIEIGDVVDVDGDTVEGQVDLMIAGSPCQGFSYAGKQLNFEDPRSVLFFEFVRLLKTVKPRYFILENVKMKAEWQDIISDALGVKPIQINSALVSAQNRNRLYWTNIPNINQPCDKGIRFDDILLPLEDVAANFEVPQSQIPRFTNIEKLTEGGVKVAYRDPSSNCEKAVCIVARDYKGIGGREHRNAAMQDGVLRRLTPIEYERLQTLPDNYTSSVSNTQRYKMLGNGWTVDVIVHILMCLKFRLNDMKEII
jgi:site-specific DNA-cytosine methylase